MNGYIETGARGFRLVSDDGEALTNWRKHRTDAYKEFNRKRATAQRKGKENE